LVVFAPFLAELVSGSTAPQAWILPQVALIFMAIYGVSALVIREFTLRSGGGPATVVILGLVFGIVNEGMAAHSLFNPAWPDLGALATYGRWEGVNWVWSAWILPFHAVWSIAFPIFLTGQFWPESRTTRFLSDRWLAGLAAVPFVVAITVGLVFEGYPPTLGEWVGMFATVGALVFVARRWGPRLSAWRLRPHASAPAWVGALTGAAFFLGGQVGTWQTPKLGPDPVVGFLWVVALASFLAAVATTFDESPEGRRARFACVLTGVGFYAALSPGGEFLLGKVALVPIDVVVWTALYLLYRRRTRPWPSAEGIPVVPPPPEDPLSPA
jgi:hypothetical protein